MVNILENFRSNFQSSINIYPRSTTGRAYVPWFFERENENERNVIIGHRVVFPLKHQRATSGRLKLFYTTTVSDVIVVDNHRIQLETAVLERTGEQRATSRSGQKNGDGGGGKPRHGRV